MKVLPRLRWPATEMPVPGTAEVSAKRSLRRVFVRDTFGDEQREVEIVAAVQRQRVDFLRA